MTDAKPDLMASRKFRALCIGIACQGLIILLTAAMVFQKHAAFDDFIGVVKWLAPSLSLMITGYMGSQAYEDRGNNERKQIDLNIGGQDAASTSAKGVSASNKPTGENVA